MNTLKIPCCDSDYRPELSRISAASVKYCRRLDIDEISQVMHGIKNVLLGIKPVPQDMSANAWKVWTKHVAPLMKIQQ